MFLFTTKQVLVMSIKQNFGYSSAREFKVRNVESLISPSNYIEIILIVDFNAYCRVVDQTKQANSRELNIDIN